MTFILFVKFCYNGSTTDKTRSSAVAEGTRDALYQLKSSQLLHNCTKNRILKGLQ